MVLSINKCLFNPVAGAHQHQSLKPSLGTGQGGCLLYRNTWPLSAPTTTLLHKSQAATCVQASCRVLVAKAAPPSPSDVLGGKAAPCNPAEGLTLTFQIGTVSSTFLVYCASHLEWARCIPKAAPVPLQSSRCSWHQEILFSSPLTPNYLLKMFPGAAQQQKFPDNLSA